MHDLRHTMVANMFSCEIPGISFVRKRWFLIRIGHCRSIIPYRDMWCLWESQESYLPAFAPRNKTHVGFGLKIH